MQQRPVPAAALPQAPRDAALTAVRSELAASSARLAAIRRDETAELDRIATLAELATDAGLSLHQVAETAGVSRRTLTTARNEGRGDPNRMNVDVRVALALGAPQAVSPESLVAEVATGPVREHEVHAALQRLIDAGEARLIGTGVSGDDAVEYYRLTVLGAAALPGRLRQATMSKTREWTIYVRSTEQEARALVKAAALQLGEHEVGVIPAGTAHGMSQPEVAWRIEASTVDQARDEAVMRTRAMREQIGADPHGEVVISAVTAPMPLRFSPDAV